MSNKFGDDLMSGNCDVIVIFSIYGQFRAIPKPDSGCRVCKNYVFINSNLLFYKNWKQNWKIFNTALTILLKVVFLPKKVFFCKKLLTSAKVNNGTLKSIVSLHRILLKKVNTEIFVQFMRKKHSRGKILLINHLRISFTCISDHDTISFCPGLILLYSNWVVSKSLSVFFSSIN